MAGSPGTIAVGKSADLVLLDANPLENIRNVAKVRDVWRRRPVPEAWSN